MLRMSHRVISVVSLSTLREPVPRPPTVPHARTHALAAYYIWACRSITREAGFCASTGYHPDLYSPLKLRANECHSVLGWCENHHSRLPDKARKSLGWTPAPIPNRMAFHRLFKTLGLKPSLSWCQIEDVLGCDLQGHVRVGRAIPGLLLTISYYTRLFREYKHATLKKQGANRLLQLNKYNSITKTITLTTYSVVTNDPQGPCNLSYEPPHHQP